MSPLQEICAIRTGPRTQGRSIKRMRTNDSDTVPIGYGKEARCELDTRADTTCAGINCRPVYYTGQHCKAYGFHSDLSPINNVPIATVATAWSDPHTGESYIIIINKALYFGDGMDNSLLHPNQIPTFGLEL